MQKWRSRAAESPNPARVLVNRSCSPQAGPRHDSFLKPIKKKSGLEPGGLPRSHGLPGLGAYVDGAHRPATCCKAKYCELLKNPPPPARPPPSLTPEEAGLELQPDLSIGFASGGFCGRHVCIVQRSQRQTCALGCSYHRRYE